MVATATSELRRRGDLDVLAWPVFDGLDLDALVTTRGGGVSSGPYTSLNLSLNVGDQAEDVLENRRRASAALGADLDDLVFCNQVHGRDVRVVSHADRGRGSRGQDDAIPQTDALVTAEPGIGLVVMVADCVPMVLYDPVAHVLACVHAGWRGTVARIGEAAVAAMGELGSTPGNVIAGLGPAVSPDHYQVDDDVIEAAEQNLGSSAITAIQPDGTGKWLFDLWAANRAVLLEAGLTDAHVSVAGIATGAVGQDLFFSDRQARPCGRFAVIARLRPRGER